MKVEYTDTFGGEANYSWVRRGSIADAKTDREAVRRAKAWAGLTGHPCRVERVGRDYIAVYPRRLETVLFVIWEV
jgi:hypothetical protein